MLQTIIRPYSTDKVLPNDVRSIRFTEYHVSSLLLFDNKPNKPDECYSVTHVLLHGALDGTGGPLFLMSNMDVLKHQSNVNLVWS